MKRFALALLLLLVPALAFAGDPPSWVIGPQMNAGKAMAYVRPDLTYPPFTTISYADGTTVPCGWTPGAGFTPWTLDVAAAPIPNAAGDPASVESYTILVYGPHYVVQYDRWEGVLWSFSWGHVFGWYFHQTYLITP